MRRALGWAMLLAAAAVALAAVLLVAPSYPLSERTVPISTEP